VGTGTGFVAFEVASLIEDGHVVGIDAEEDALLLARHKAAKRGISNITFQAGDALDLEFEEHAFDVALANQVPIPLPDKLSELVRVLRPGGIVGIARPFSPTTRSSNGYTM
jgi:ubiquinone/menaquinone biosynthesis C-methylase UbiE